MDTKLTQASQHLKDNIRDIQKELFFLKKVEKLTSALYKVTEHMPDEEPLKWKMRNEGLELLSSSMSFIDNRRDTTHHDLSIILHNTSRIVSLLEVSYMGSFVSQMNFRVLKDEYDSLSSSITSYKGEREVSPALSVTKDEIEQKDESHTQEGIKRTFIKDIKDNEVTLDSLSEPNTIFKVGHLTPSRTMTGISQTVRPAIKARSASAHKPRNSKDKEKRRDLILSFIKNKHEEVSIKDIFELPELKKNYSEKTIQRELIDMVDKGVLKKKGERRWSRYYL
ncbi:hypothetical protein CL654_03245 [bacterium]|nr:hypothetical protein [bacterium]|tara:strand:+ start:6613 stop:7455 length:843 start_codon:yes stop_codon:yes gene_type:complete